MRSGPAWPRGRSGTRRTPAAWWTGTPAQYAALLRTAYAAIKAADPKATVLLGGLTGNDVSYLNELYGAGARGSFDAVAVHTDTACNVTSPYVFEFDRGTQTINQYFFLGFTAIHAAMIAAGDGAKPIYMTELGWSSTTAECETGAWAGQKLAGVGEQTQATYLQQAYHCLAQPQYAYVKAAMWFELVDDGDSTAPLDNYGLLDNDYTPKPAFAAFEQESLQGDQLTGPCGTAAVKSPAIAHPKERPVIRILRPTAGAHYTGPLEIAVTASAPAAGVREITIELTSTKRVHFMAKGFPATFSRVFAWRRAKLLHAGPPSDQGHRRRKARHRGLNDVQRRPRSGPAPSLDLNGPRGATRPSTGDAGLGAPSAGPGAVAAVPLHARALSHEESRVRAATPGVAGQRSARVSLDLEAVVPARVRHVAVGAIADDFAERPHGFPDQFTGRLREVGRHVVSRAVGARRHEAVLRERQHDAADRRLCHRTLAVVDVPETTGLLERTDHRIACVLISENVCDQCPDCRQSCRDALGVMPCSALGFLLFPWVDECFRGCSSHARAAFEVVLSGYVRHQSCADD